MCLSLPSRPSHQISNSGSARPVRPVFVLEKFLAHENHRDARCRQDNSRGDFGPAARVPGTRVGRVSERGDARLTVAAGVIEVEQVVVLDALKDSPAPGIFVSQIKGIAQLVEVDSSVAAAGGLSDDFTQFVAQRVAVADVEAHSVRRDGYAFPAFVAPIFGDLDGGRLDVTQGVREILGKIPAAVFVNHGDLVVTQPVDVILLEQGLAVIDQELPDLLLPEREDAPAGVILVGEIEAVIVRRVRLPIEELDALIVEAAARVIVDHVRDHRDPVEMAEINERFELIDLPGELGRGERSEPFAASKRFTRATYGPSSAAGTA